VLVIIYFQTRSLILPPESAKEQVFVLKEEIAREIIICSVKQATNLAL